MAGKNTLIKSFFNDKGLDLRSSDLVREPQFASELLNTDYRKTGALNKRKGFQSITENTGGGGSGIYANINTTTGAIVEELVTAGVTLSRLVDELFTITYTGSGIATTNIFVDPLTNTFKFQITEDDIILVNKDLGVGIDEASIVTVSNLKTIVDALVDFTSVISGNPTIPAAFLTIQRDTILNSLGVSIPFVAFEAINSSVASPLFLTNSNKDDAEFKNASFVNLQNILYVATGYDHLHKYDGQTFYRAGMPKGITPTTVSGGVGVITNSDLKYILTYIQIDNKGNVVEGIESDPSTGLNFTNEQTDLTITNILNTTGFNTNCGIVAGAQGPVNTITLDDGSGGNHTLQIGDTAYFFDSVSGDYVTRNISGRTTNNITIDGAAVTVTDNVVISNNLRIGIYRNQSAGTTSSLVVELPNNSFTSTQAYTDNLADVNLGANYLVPIKQHGLPPKGRYLTVFRNQLIISGDLLNVNTVYYSDVDGPEFFPAGDNSVLVETNFGDKVSGLSTNNNSLFIFKEQSIHVLTGDIVNDQIRVDIVSGGDVGCVSHHTISEVKGKLIFLGEKGVFGLTVGDNEPEEVSFRVEPIFRDTSTDFNLTKAVSINWFQKDKYVLFLPSELTSSLNEKYTDKTNSKLLVFDYSRGAWLEWNNIDMQGGATVLNNKLHFTERRLSTITGNVEFNSYKFLDTGDTYDYADHNVGIIWNHKSHWEALQEPDVYKKFTRLKVSSLDASVNDFETDAFTLAIETQINYIDARSSAFDLIFDSGEGWGEFEWGVAPWGSSRGILDKSKLKAMKAQSIRVIFTNNTIHENILISGWTLEANLPYKTRIKE